MKSHKFHELLTRAMPKGSTKRTPATSAELARLVLPRYRDGSGDAAPPKSLLALLALDRQFSCCGEPLVPAPKAKSQWRLAAVTIDATIRDLLPRFAELPKNVKLWNDDAKLPALVPLPARGDQRNFLYISELDEDGEYPIVTFDDQPEVFLSRASLAEYVAEELVERLGEKVDVAKSFRTARARAKKRHANVIAKERWSDDPVLVHFLETGELPVENAKSAGKRSHEHRDVKELVALRKMNWWEKPYKVALRALIDDAASFDDDDLLEVVRTGPWPSGNAAAQMVVANAAGKPNAAVATAILEIDRRRALDLRKDRYAEGWCQHGFHHELSKALVAIFMKHPGALEEVRSSTEKAGVKPVYETFLAPLLRKAMKVGKISVPID